MKIRSCFSTTILFLCSVAVTLHTQPTIPQEYQALYSELDLKLRDIDSYISTRWDGSKYPVAFSTELLVANSNRGEVLLDPKTIQAVSFTLDRFLQLGIKGVSVSCDYPILVPTFPRSSEYLEFYKKVAQEVKKRNMILQIGAQTVFRDTVFSNLPVDYSGLTIDKYKQEKRVMIERIIQDIHPDYLTVENEPQTMQMNTGLNFSVQNVINIVQYILDGLDRKGALVGAGAGTWDNLLYIQSLATNTSIDFIDVHIYPIQKDYVIDKVPRIAAIAKATNKKLILGEAWTYKAAESELGGVMATQPEIFARDVFGFWIPLDQAFLTSMVKLCHYWKFDFASFFWMKFFYAYIDYNDATKKLTPVQLLALEDAAAAKNILSNTLTATGVTYKNLIASSTSVEPTSVAPVSIELDQNYPNPFTRSTAIGFRLPAVGYVNLKVYDAYGREVATLVEEERNAGTHSVEFNAEHLESGLYVYRLTTPSLLRTRAMHVLK